MHVLTSTMKLALLTLSLLARLAVSLPSPSANLTSLSLAATHEQFELTTVTVEDGLTTPSNLACGSAYEIWIRHTSAPGSTGHKSDACGKMVSFFSGLTSNHNAADLWVVCLDNTTLAKAKKGTRPTKLAFSFHVGQWIAVQSRLKEQTPSGVLRIEDEKGVLVLQVEVHLGVLLRDAKGGKGKDVLVQYIYCT